MSLKLPYYLSDGRALLVEVLGSPDSENRCDIFSAQITENEKNALFLTLTENAFQCFHRNDSQEINKTKSGSLLYRRGMCRAPCKIQFFF